MSILVRDTEMTEAEQLSVAEMTCQILEMQVKAVENQRRAFIEKFVKLNSKNRIYWYVSDSTGAIPIWHDAAFMATGVHVIGSLTGATHFSMGVQNLWPQREATQGSTPSILASATSTILQDRVITIPINHFVPALDPGFGTLQATYNVDYWYTPCAEWLLTRGDTVRCTFLSSTTDSAIPTVVLSGYKVKQ